jgi:hypothetical protein
LTKLASITIGILNKDPIVTIMLASSHIKCNINKYVGLDEGCMIFEKVASIILAMLNKAAVSP